MKPPLFDWDKMPLDDVPRYDVRAWSRMPIISAPAFGLYLFASMDADWLNLAGYQWPTSIEPSQLAAVTWLDEATA